MKKTLSVLLAFVLMISLASVVFAETRGSTCSNNDGGIMITSSATYGDWFYVTSYVEHENGSHGMGYYRHHVYKRDVVKKLVCTVNSSHTDTFRYTDTREEVEFQAYGN